MENREALLDEYRNGFSRLHGFYKGLDAHSLTFYPKREDAWSIKDHLIHLVDSEINGFIRLKSIIAQPGSECYVMDEDTWTRNIKDKNEDLEKYMALLGLIRELSYGFIKNENIENWNNQYFIRTYQGNTVQVTIEKWLEVYNNHLQFHLEYMEKIKNEFLAEKK